MKIQKRAPNQATGRADCLKPRERRPNVVKKVFINFKMDHFKIGFKNRGGQTREGERCLLKATPTFGLEKGASL
jgi:hypothetical protein